jgi:PDZ domain-containing protein
VDGTPVVAVDGLPVYPTSGHLNMTTVSLTDRITMFTALEFWASGDRQVVPRAVVYPPTESSEEIQQENKAQFESSEINAESAAVAELGLPATVVVMRVEPPDGPAAAVLQEGDELLAMGDKPLDSVAALTSTLANTRPGDTVSVTYRRNGEPRTANIVLGAGQDRTNGLLGVVPAGTLRDGDVSISLGGIGGPSAGLMFALALVDKLTPGGLTGGQFIAGTGAILSNGVVTKINGIPLKMQRAQEAGASVFFVPAENCEEASSAAPGGLQLVRVETLHDAVVALDALQAGRPVATC